MTKKNYKAFAALLAECKQDECSMNQVIVRIADIFAADNPRFDRDTFFSAAGLWIKGKGEYARTDSEFKSE